MNRKRTPRVVSLFTGAGGLDLGFEAVGFENLVCLELDNDARSTLIQNRPDWNLWPVGDIHQVEPSDVLNSLGLAPGDVDVVLGGPPCQPFSKAAYWSSGDTQRLQDERANTLRATMTYVEEMLPRVLILENVKGISFKGKDEAITYLDRRLRQINSRNDTKYNLTLHPFRATDFGVPQCRERNFLFAFRDGQEFRAPSPTHGEITPDAAQNLCRIPTAWDAIGDIKITKREQTSLAPRGKWAELLPSIPEGQNYLWHTERGGGLPLFGWRTRYWSFLLKLSRELPAWTLQASPGPATGPFHWDNRHLSIREMCRIQTFPDEYQIIGNYGSARRQIGNAVPPALAEAIAAAVRGVLLKDTYTPERMYMIKPRRRSSRRETVKEVPKKFLHLLGDHDDHPGTGLGPGALAREANEKRPSKSSNIPKERHHHPDRYAVNISRKQLSATKVA